MTAIPFAPTPFSSPVINPSVGGFGRPYPYLSVSQYQFAPTAMDTSNLVENGDDSAQLQALADTIRRASGWADRYCFGADPASKGASLCATQSVESARLKVLRGCLSLVCDYMPILELDGLAVGTSPQSLQSLTALQAQTIEIGRKVITVPIAGPGTVLVGGIPDSAPFGYGAWGGRGGVYAVWSYVAGYPHTYLTADVIEGATSLHVAPTGPGSSVFGIYPGTTQMDIVDGVLTETVTVTAVNGTTLTTTATQHAHSVPEAPDFLPVTCVPADVEIAVIFLTTALIKSRGDAALVLGEINEPTDVKATVGSVEEDVANALERLDPFRSVVKMKR